MQKLLKKLFGSRGAKTTAGQLAKKFGLELRGKATEPVNGVAPIADATAGQLAFYSTEKNNATFKILPIETLKHTKATIILLQPEMVKYAPHGATLLVSDSPRAEIVKILGAIYADKPKRGVDFTARVERGVFFRRRRTSYVGPYAVVQRGAVIERGVHIGANAFVGAGVILGENTVVAAGAHIENATVGRDCVVYTGAVIGKDGFGFTRQNGKNIFIPHVGRVILGDRVSVGANSCIDRGVMTDTTIGDGTKIDNLCQIAHGVIIGKECFLAGGVGLAGGVVIGDHAMLGGHVGVANKVRIGNNASVGANSGVLRDVPDGQSVSGSPAVPGMEFMRMHAWLRKQIKNDK